LRIFSTRDDAVSYRNLTASNRVISLAGFRRDPVPLRAEAAGPRFRRSIGRETAPRYLSVRYCKRMRQPWSPGGLKIFNRRGAAACEIR
jgi:hypothetical protein